MSDDAEPDPDDGWRFALAGEHIEQLRLDQRVGMLVGDGTLIVIESPFRLALDGTVVEIAPHDPATITPALGLLRRATASLHLSRAGTLVLELADGGRVDVAVDPGYENWQVVDPGGTMYIGQPGGGVMVFPAA